MNNISTQIQSKRRLKLHNNKRHPICQLKNIIFDFFEGFEKFDNLDEVVSLKENFDDLLIPKDHPARSENDTYYVDNNHVLRTHTSAHQNNLMKKGYTKFLVVGDVYRKDTIDKTHYPIFHQIEGVSILDKEVNALDNLKETLSKMIEFLYPNIEYRYLEDSFPFTINSIQAEIKNSNGDWVEILGAGVIHPKILENCGLSDKTGWAFGFGLDRLVLNFCDISDIRQLWVEDERFLNQFENGLTKFIPYSHHPTISRDISFWVYDYVENDELLWELHNNFCEIVRNLGNDLSQEIKLLDKYSRNGRTSLMYRIVYQSYSRSLTNDEINVIHNNIRSFSEKNFKIELR